MYSNDLSLFTTLKKYIIIIIIKPLRPGTLAGLADGSPEGTEGRWAPLFPRGAGPQEPWAIGIRTF